MTVHQIPTSPARLGGGWRVPDDPMGMLLTIAEREGERVRMGQKRQYTLAMLVAIYEEMKAYAESLHAQRTE